MSQERLLQILRAPHVSEKTNRLTERHNQVVFEVLCDATKPEIKSAVFEVLCDATKPEIKSAVEMLFNVKVKGVTVLNVKGKRKRFGGRIGQRSDWKKAYVSLEAGHEIDFLVAE